MHGIVFVVYPGFELLDASGPTSVFNGANRALTQRNKPPFYSIGIASAAGGPVASSSRVAVETRENGTFPPEDVATLLVAGAEREPLLAAVSDAALRKALPSLAAKADRYGWVCARRPGYQSQFSPVLKAQVKRDSSFGELISWIQTNLDQQLDVSSLAERAGMTERTFHRRFVAATGTTPARFVEIARLDAARMLLSRGRSLKSVAAEVGLFPPARLTEAFERRLGIAPRLFRDMHGEF